MMEKKNSYDERDKKKIETKGKMMTNNDRGERMIESCYCFFLFQKNYIKMFPTIRIKDETINKSDWPSQVQD